MESKEWRPQHFDEQWTNIKTMRRFRDAPVDIIGCDKLGDPSEQPKVCKHYFHFCFFHLEFLCDSR